MNQPLFPVQDSTLAAGALADTIRTRYDLPGEPWCRFFRKGICDTYLVEAGDRTYYLKVYRHGRRAWLDVSEEVRLLNYLAKGGVSVALPVRQRDGTYVEELSAPEGVRYAVLFEAAEGVSGDGGDEGRIRALGETVARIHEVTDEMSDPYQRAHLDMHHLVDENMPAIAHLMQHRQEDLRLIEQIGHVCKARVTRLLPTTQPEYGVCHGDLHGGDVCYDDSGKPVLFDFDSSGCGWRALDVGVFLASDNWMDVTPEAEDRRQRKLACFLEGYARVRTLSESELAIVQLGPPVRHIFLMGFVLRYTAPREGIHWANDGFIDWHMAWFRHWVAHQPEI